MKILIPILASLIILTGCTTTSAMTEEEQKLAWVKAADATADAELALDRNDLRMLAISTRGTNIPGIERSEVAQFEQACGVRFLEGAGDTIRNDEHMRLMKLAVDYAKQYNAIIKQRCKPD